MTSHHMQSFASQHQSWDPNNGCNLDELAMSPVSEATRTQTMTPTPATPPPDPTPDAPHADNADGVDSDDAQGNDDMNVETGRNNETGRNDARKRMGAGGNPTTVDSQENERHLNKKTQRAVNRLEWHETKPKTEDETRMKIPKSSVAENTEELEQVDNENEEENENTVLRTNMVMHVENCMLKTQQSQTRLTRHWK